MQMDGWKIIFQMQKHNEWLSNKGYLRHLQVLNKISQRKTHSLNPYPSAHNRTAPIRQINHQPHHNQSPHSPREDDTSPSPRKTSPKNIQLLWDNYQLGKRIIQTPPVISKKKQDQEYRRHRMIVQSMTASSSRRAMPTDFRVKKLQEYKENVEQQHLELAQQSAHLRNFITIQVTGLSFYQKGQSLDNLTLLFIYGTRSGKRHKQSTHSFPAEQLLYHPFCFSISRRLLKDEEPLVLQVRNMKGLELFSIGCASFPSGMELIRYVARLFHCGKAIGQIEMSTAFNRITE